MAQEILIVSLPASEVPIPERKSGSTLGPCRDCGEDVILSPDSQKALSGDIPCVVSCLWCFSKKQPGNAEMAIKLLTDNLKKASGEVAPLRD